MYQMRDRLSCGNNSQVGESYLAINDQNAIRKLRIRKYRSLSVANVRQGFLLLRD